MSRCRQVRRHGPTGALIAALLLAGIAHAIPAGLQGLLQRLPDAQHAQLEARLQHWQGLDATGREALRERHRQWQALDIHLRRDIREAWLAWQALTPAEHQRMRSASAYRSSLPRDEQLALLARFEALDAHERHGWLLGPELGRDWPRLQPLLAQVPANEREDLLRVLRQMNRQQREDLGVLAQRVPPQARAELREALIQTPPAQRAQWLRARLGG